MAFNPPETMEMLLDPLAYKIRINRPVPDPKRHDHGWRTDMLAIPRGHKEELEMFSLSDSEVAQYKRMKQEILNRNNPARRRRQVKRINEIFERHLPDFALQPKRVYLQQRKTWGPLLGKKFESRMKKYIDKTKTNTYLEYEHARAKLKKEGKGPYAKTKAKGKKGKGRKKRSKKEILAAAIENLDRVATPKKPAKPPKIDRGKHGDIDAVTLYRLQTPKFVTPKFIDDSNERWRDEHFVPEKALVYKPSPRILELAVPHVRVVDGPVVLGYVEPDALTYRPTARILELAIPKKHNAVQEAVVNEDAFKVSENAKHYKASERIIELSKPLVRE